MAARVLALAVAATSCLAVATGPATAATQVGDVKLVKISPRANLGAALKTVDENKDGVGTFDRVLIKPYLNTSSSKWRMRVWEMGTGWWVVSFQNTYYGNQCLDKSTSFGWYNPDVYLYPCHYDTNQKWVIYKRESISGADVFDIQNDWSHTYLQNWETDTPIRVDSLSYDRYAIYVIG